MAIYHQPPPTPVRIPTRSHKQAMDWSLALVSQGIDTIIAPPDDSGRWAVIVPWRDSERAFKTLRQYHAENRNFPWQTPLKNSDLRFDYGSIVWAVALLVCHRIAHVSRNFENAGIMDSVRVHSGQWWRVFTAMMLHENVNHLVQNVGIGIFFLGIAMGAYGTGNGLLAAYLAGVVGNLASLVFHHQPFAGLGASGMVMGAIGMVAAQAISPELRRRPTWANIIVAIFVGLLFFALFGLASESDIIAHAGGFAGGFGFGTILVFCPGNWRKNNLLNFSTGTATIALIWLTWHLALLHVKD